jgi:hypothetical protein
MRAAVVMKALLRRLKECREAGISPADDNDCNVYWATLRQAEIDDLIEALEVIEGDEPAPPATTFRP